MDELKKFICDNIIKVIDDFHFEDILIRDLGCPHKPELPPKGYSTVYMFIYNDIFLKIGKAGLKSSPRVLSHHYYCKAPSTLAKSILRDPTMNGFNLSEENVGDWIKKNCKRINIYINSDNKFILNYVEALLQLKYQPKYEG